MFTNNLPEEELKRLTDVITDAIIKSNEAKALLADMYKRGLIDSSIVMLLALNIQNIDTIKIETDCRAAVQTNTNNSNLPVVKTINKSDIENQYIDGQRLSKNEIDFYERCAEHFDEDRWLKNLGIKIKS